MPSTSTSCASGIASASMPAVAAGTKWSRVPVTTAVGARTSRNEAFTAGSSVERALLDEEAAPRRPPLRAGDRRLRRAPRVVVDRIETDRAPQAPARELPTEHERGRDQHLADTRHGEHTVDPVETVRTDRRGEHERVDALGESLRDRERDPATPAVADERRRGDPRVVEQRDHCACIPEEPGRRRGVRAVAGAVGREHVDRRRERAPQPHGVDGAARLPVQDDDGRAGAQVLSREVTTKTCGAVGSPSRRARAARRASRCPAHDARPGSRS